MKMRANYILIETETWVEQKVGSIAIPTAAKNAFARGIVKGVGPGLFLPNGERPPIEAEVGDHVLYFKASAAGIVVSGQEMHIVQEREILAILEPNDFTDEGDSDAAN